MVFNSQIGFDPDANAATDTDAQFAARKAFAIKQAEQDYISARQEGIVREPKAPRWSAEDLAATEVRVAEAAAKEEELRRNPLSVLPENIRTKRAVDMTDSEYAQALRAVGVGDLSSG